MSYKYFKKGEAIRRALTEDDKVYFIFEGSVSCAIPDDTTVYNPSTKGKIIRDTTPKPEITVIKNQGGFFLTSLQQNAAKNPD